MRDSKLAYTVDEASERTGIGRNTLRKLIEWKKLPVLKVGRRLLIRADTLEMFIQLNMGIAPEGYDDIKNFAKALDNPIKSKTGKTYVEIPNPERKPTAKKKGISR